MCEEPAAILDENTANLNCKGTFTGHTGPVWGLAVTGDGLLVSASSDMTIKVFYFLFLFLLFFLFIFFIIIIETIFII